MSEVYSSHCIPPGGGSIKKRKPLKQRRIFARQLGFMQFGRLAQDREVTDQLGHPWQRLAIHAASQEQEQCLAWMPAHPSQVAETSAHEEAIHRRLTESDEKHTVGHIFRSLVTAFIRYTSQHSHVDSAKLSYCRRRHDQRVDIVHEPAHNKRTAQMKFEPWPENG